MQTRKKAPDYTKAHGVHYTPPKLAAFLADVTAAAVRQVAGPFRVLDPACGDGGLLVAIANALPKPVRHWLTIEGYETDAGELAKAGASLAQLGVGNVTLHNRDFLSEEGVGNLAEYPGLFDEEPAQQYDVVIANPPYVRTQVMGAKQSQALSRKFGLTGRVDLYHAFAIAITSVLKPGGVVGLLTSNRFLTIKSGASLREMFSSHFAIEAIYDLGDTKLFTAAVLPVIIVARKGKTQSRPNCAFHRIYEYRNGSERAPASRDSILSALRDSELSGLVETPSGAFYIQRGKLAVQSDAWTLSNTETNDWLETVAARQVATFGDLAKVRVGIKSTADEVFVRDGWENLPADIQPEAELLHPLLTHREAARWLPKPAAKRVIYPHVMEGGKRSAIELADYPKAAAYFERHRARLARRTYVIDGGRKWYEIWVPHNPGDWGKPKIAYPDISEHPRFFFDASGAIVQGDCYWITLNGGVDANWLLLMLAIANSTFITKYYDTVFHNKLYAGRRRFMTQYVAKFPLPDLAASRRIVEEVSKLLKKGEAAEAAERGINRLVWEAFGLAEELPWQGSR
jgi:methylase of polypeptide subunit release factors